MASILDISEISDTFLENLVAELNYHGHEAHPHMEFNNEEENLCEDLLDVLDSLSSPVPPLNVASHHVDQNFSVFGYTNWGLDDISFDIDRYIMEAEEAAPSELTSQVVPNLSDLLNNFDSASSSGNICWNVGGDLMQLEHEEPCEIASKDCQNLNGLGCVNYNSGWSSRNIDCDVDGSVMRADQAAPSELTSQVVPNLNDLGYFDSDTSSSYSGWNVGGDLMQAEQAIPRQVASKVCHNLNGLDCINYSQIGRNLNDLGCINYDTGSSSGNICWNVGEDLIQLEHEAPREIISKSFQKLDGLGYSSYDLGWSNNIGCSVGEDIMQLEQSASGELTSQVGQLSVLGCINFDSDTSSCNVSWTRMTKLNSSCNAILKYCEPDINAAIENHQMEKLLSHERTTTPVYSTEQSEYASQQRKCEVQLIGKSCEIPLKSPHLEETTTYPCTECGKQFRQKSLLAIHSRIHTGEKPYKCSHCDYACTRASDIASHKRRHSDVRPFKCSTCDAAFKFKSNLTDHQGTHSAAKPFKCLICGAAFKLRSYLARHQMTHKGERPYECNVCNKTFRQRPQLSQHRKCCHGKQKAIFD